MNSAHASFFLALCNETALPGFGAALALNFEGDKPLPEWVELLPAGSRLEGLDGREWTLDNPEALVAAFNRRGLTLPIDLEHAQFIKAPKGEPAPAYAWIEELQIRCGKTMGRVSWNQNGASAVRTRKYRYLSPAFSHDAQGRVTELLGAGLVNRPNFQMAALNHEAPPMKELLKKLGLPETATEAEGIAKVSELQTSLNSTQVNLVNYVPRADYQLAVNRAQAAEEALTARTKAEHDSEVTRLLDEAVKGGKIAPASKSFYLSTCASAEGLAAFRQFVADAPTLFKEAVQPGQDGPAGVALNAEQKATAEAMGFDEKAFADFIASQK
jgi:phage I-like protein